MTQNSIINLTLENFRSYLKKTSIDFGSKITLLFGKGSAGKSTIIDALQMLHASHKNNIDLFEKNSKYILSRNTNSKEFRISISCSENSDNKKSNVKVINKLFSLDKKEVFFPKKVEICSDEGDGVKQKFLEIENEPISNNIDKNKNIRDFYISKVSYIDNQYAYEELFDYTLKYKDRLIINLDKCNEFRKKYNELSLAEEKARKEKKIKEADEIEKKLRDLFKPKDDDILVELTNCPSI